MCIRGVNSSCYPSARRTDKDLSWWRMRSRQQLQRPALVEAVVVAPRKHLRFPHREELLPLQRLPAEEAAEVRRPLHRPANNKKLSRPSPDTRRLTMSCLGSSGLWAQKVRGYRGLVDSVTVRFSFPGPPEISTSRLDVPAMREQ